MGLFNFRKTPDNSSNNKNNTQKTSLLRTIPRQRLSVSSPTASN